MRHSQKHSLGWVDPKVDEALWMQHRKFHHLLGESLDPGTMASTTDLTELVDLLLRTSDIVVSDIWLLFDHHQGYSCINLWRKRKLNLHDTQTQQFSNLRASPT